MKQEKEKNKFFWVPVYIFLIFQGVIQLVHSTAKVRRKHSRVPSKKAVIILPKFFPNSATHSQYQTSSLHQFKNLFVSYMEKNPWRRLMIYVTFYSKVANLRRSFCHQQATFFSCIHSGQISKPLFGSTLTLLSCIYQVLLNMVGWSLTVMLLSIGWTNQFHLIVY